MPDGLLLLAVTMLAHSATLIPHQLKSMIKFSKFYLFSSKNFQKFGISLAIIFFLVNFQTTTFVSPKVAKLLLYVFEGSTRFASKGKKL
jgi:hypothetical protein